MEDTYSNEVNDDHLGDLLKKVDLQEPSDPWVDQVINAYAVQKDPSKFRLLKAPLFLMGGLGLFLLLPWIISLAEMMANHPSPRLPGSIQDLSFEFSIWYLICPLALLLSLTILVLVEMRSIAFQKTNRSAL